MFMCKGIFTIKENIKRFINIYNIRPKFEF